MVTDACDCCGPPWSCGADQNNELLIIQCAGFGPDLDEDTKHHRGVYPKYFQRFVSEGYHKPLIQRVITGLKEALDKMKRHIRIVFLDYHGIHSNVAACKVIAACVNETIQLRMADVILHAQENDTAPGGRFNDTFYPETEHPAVQVALDTVVNYFRNQHE